MAQATMSLATAMECGVKRILYIHEIAQNNFEATVLAVWAKPNQACWEWLFDDSLKASDVSVQQSQIVHDENSKVITL